MDSGTGLCGPCDAKVSRTTTTTPIEVEHERYCRYCGRELQAVTKQGSYDPYTGERRTYEERRCPSFWCRLVNGG
jgi:hypothetical protein